MNLFRIILIALAFCLAADSALAKKKEEDEINFLDLAALMLRDGNLDRALSALDQVNLEEEGLDIKRYYTLRGMTHLRRNEPEAAVEALESAVATGEAESVVYVYLAQTYFQMQRYRDVLNTLEKAGPELDRVASIYHMRAQCHWLLEEYAMALAVLDQATEVFPDDAGFLRRKVFFLIDLGLYKEAAELGRIYLSRSEETREDYIALGNALRASGELDEASRLLELARLRYPTDTDVKKVLAHTYLDQEMYNSAADLIFEAALMDRELTSEAAEIYRRAGRSNRALMLNGEVLDQEIKLKQRLALFLELQRYSQAAAMERDLQRLGLLTDEDIRYALAYAVFKTGDFDGAETHLAALTRPDLFRKAAELRRVMQDCSEDPWQCL